MLQHWRFHRPSFGFSGWQPNGRHCHLAAAPVTTCKTRLGGSTALFLFVWWGALDSNGFGHKSPYFVVVAVVVVRRLFVSAGGTPPVWSRQEIWEAFICIASLCDSKGIAWRDVRALVGLSNVRARGQVNFFRNRIILKISEFNSFKLIQSTNSVF